MSKVISERFNKKTIHDFGEVSIRDKADKHGIVVLGTVEGAEEVVKILKEILPDVVVREKSLKGWLGYGCFNVEFPYLSKKLLDKIRNKVTPTIPNHHKLRIFASSFVDEAEKKLCSSPEMEKELEEMLKMLINFEVGEEFKIDHVKPDGWILNLKGEITNVKPTGTLEVKRKFRGKGFYDGLKIPKDEGDYCITKIKEGSWIVKHTYYSSENNLKGEFYNINTPVEFYPGKARYIDLEVDVVKRPGEEPEIIDLEVLEKVSEEGFITEKLTEAAKEIAEKLVETLPETKKYEHLAEQIKPKFQLLGNSDC